MMELKISFLFSSRATVDTALVWGSQNHETPWTIACQALLCIELSRQECWSGLLQGIFPTQGSNTGLLHCRQILYHLWAITLVPSNAKTDPGQTSWKSSGHTYMVYQVQLVWCYLGSYSDWYSPGHLLFSHSLVPTLRNPWTAERQASLSFTVSQSLLKFMSIELVMPPNHLIFCCPLLLLPSKSQYQGSFPMSWLRWPKYWSFSFSISPSNEYSGLISFRIDGLISLQSNRLSRSSPTPKFENINSSALSLLYSPALTSIRDHWKSHVCCV